MRSRKIPLRPEVVCVPVGHFGPIAVGMCVCDSMLRRACELLAGSTHVVVAI
jgi:hypothetical protein